MLHMLHEIRTAKELENTDFWLENETFNVLIKEAKEIRLDEHGILEIHLKDGNRVGVKLNSKLFYGIAHQAYAKVEYLNNEYKAGRCAINCKVL